MGIESPRIAAGVTKQRTRIYDQPLTVGADSPTSTPDYEGQIYIEHPTTGERNRYMHVAVDIDGTLTWKEVDTGDYIDSYTGKAWNPLSHVKGS